MLRYANTFFSTHLLSILFFLSFEELVSGIKFSVDLHQGFRKVDPDRWEFANEWFLRGQTHLLCNIVRRKHANRSSSKNDDDDEEDLMVEIAKLKQEQKSLEQELQSMNRRLEATERRPQQMMTFLCKVVQDPEILPRIMLEKEKMRTLAPDKKRKKLMIAANSSSNSLSEVALSGSSVKSEDDHEPFSMAESTPISSPDVGNFDGRDNFCQSSPSFEMSSPPPPQWRGQPSMYANFSGSSGVGGSGSGVSAMPVSSVPGGHEGAEGFGYLGGFGAGEGRASPPPYPFSLLGGGF